MESNIKKIHQLSDDLRYLQEEYEAIKLWGDCPDGDVPFDKIMKWLADNEDTVEYMIKVAKGVYND